MSDPSTNQMSRVGFCGRVVAAMIGRMKRADYDIEQADDHSQKLDDLRKTLNQFTLIANECYETAKGGGTPHEHQE